MEFIICFTQPSAGVFVVVVVKVVARRLELALDPFFFLPALHLLLLYSQCGFQGARRLRSHTAVITVDLQVSDIYWSPHYTTDVDSHADGMCCGITIAGALPDNVMQALI
jgi:hypothetical protein